MARGGASSTVEQETRPRRASCSSGRVDPLILPLPIGPALQTLGRYSRRPAFAASKLANLLFSYELGRRVRAEASRCAPSPLTPASTSTHRAAAEPGPLRGAAASVFEAAVKAVTRNVPGCGPSLSLWPPPRSSPAAATAARPGCCTSADCPP